jgi:hypothetical protein
VIARRILFAVIALAAAAAAAAVTVVAAAFAGYALLRQVMTPAEAGGLVALIAALACALGAFIAGRQAKVPMFTPRQGRRAPPPPETLIDRVVETARERPFVAAGAAVAAGLLALANPALVTAVMRAFVSPRPPRR